MSSSFQELPDDIIREIAAHCLPEFPRPTSIRPPLSLCCISSSWRHTIQSSPEFWSILFARTPDDGNHLRLLNQILQWFGHAKNHPLTFFLSLEFYHREDGHQYDHSQYEGFLAQLSPIVARTRHLGLSSRDMDVFYRYLSSKSLQWNLGNLDSFDCASDWQGYASLLSKSRRAPLVDLFKNAPRLRHLSIHGLYFSYYAIYRKFILPLSNLTTVVLEELLDAKNWEHVIQSCPRICYGDFLLDMVSFRPSGPTNRACLADLEFLLLEIQSFRGHSPVAQLVNLELPNLRTLRLDEKIEPRLMSPEAFGFQNFHCIHSLILTCGWFDGVDGMVQLFQRAVNVKELTLTFQNNKNSSSLFKAVSYAEPHIILPKLTSLRIQTNWQCWCGGFDTSGLPDMIKSRSASESPMGCERLQSLTFALNLRGPRDEEEAKEVLHVIMLSCSEAGVAFNLTFGDWDKEKSNHRAFRGKFDG